MINEKQVKELLNQIVDQELDEQDLADSEAGESKPKSGASDDQGTGSEGYPETGVWPSGGQGTVKGPANLPWNTKWPSSGQGVERGPGNKLK